ncbi:MAG: thymidine phosphorylase [Oligoflexia bacterium]|nr:thymidine phosphorylase [Oligoflexia bacterium]
MKTKEKKTLVKKVGNKKDIKNIKNIKKIKKTKNEGEKKKTIFLDACSIITKKRDGNALTREEIKWFIDGFTAKSIPSYQMASLLMAIYIRGLDKEETAYLTDAMLYSGTVLNFNDPLVIDKHSTGGIGDKTTFIIAAVVAAAGVRFPSIAGRGLGFTGGTVDKIESIKGFQAEIGLDQYKKLIYENGLVLIGQTKDLAPADKEIYALRDVTATVSSIPLITASIMSKKLAEGMAGIVLDVKFGAGAFMKSKKDAKALALSMANTCERFNKKCMAFLTDMSQPLGFAVGNSLEIIECLEALKGRGPRDLVDLSLKLAGGMIYLAGLAKSHNEGIKKAQEVLDNGEALKKFEVLVKAQGGDERYVHDYSLFKKAERELVVKSIKKGYIKSFKNEDIGLVCIDLGGGRKVATDTIDHGVGLMIYKKIGDKVDIDETLLTIHYNQGQEDLAKKIAERFVNDIIEVSSKRVSPIKLVHECIIRK